MESAQYLFLLLIQNTSLFLIGSHPPPIYSFIYLGLPILGRVTTWTERAFSSSPSAATNETEKHRYIHLIPKIKKIKSPYFTSIDITTTSKRRKLSRQKIKKKAKNVEEEFSSKVKKVKKSEKAPSAQRISGEITKSFSVISSPSGSRYTLIQRQSSAGSVESHNGQETHDAYDGSGNEMKFHSP